MRPWSGIEAATAPGPRRATFSAGPATNGDGVRKGSSTATGPPRVEVPSGFVSATRQIEPLGRPVASTVRPMLVPVVEPMVIAGEGWAAPAVSWHDIATLAPVAKFAPKIVTP
jgi:hypothetical protein